MSEGFIARQHIRQEADLETGGQGHTCRSPAVGGSDSCADHGGQGVSCDHALVGIALSHAMSSSLHIAPQSSDSQEMRAQTHLSTPVSKLRKLGKQFRQEGVRALHAKECDLNKNYDTIFVL